MDVLAFDYFPPNVITPSLSMETANIQIQPMQSNEKRHYFIYIIPHRIKILKVVYRM
jgi:hypothetical protein